MTARAASAPQRQTVTQEAPQPIGLLDQVLERTCERLDTISREADEAMAQATGKLKKAMILAGVIHQLRWMIDQQIMGRVMSLMNTRLGFLTDKDPNRGSGPAYPEETIKECFIAAILNGANLAGNEWNIIASNCYLTKAFWQRKVQEVPGITDLILSPGSPRVVEGNTFVRFAASWKINGIDGQLMGPDGKPGRLFGVIVRSGATVDNLIGKATAKAYKAIYEQVTGTQQTVPTAEGEVDETKPAAAGAKSRTDALADRLGAAPDNGSGSPAGEQPSFLDNQSSGLAFPEEAPEAEPATPLAATLQKSIDSLPPKDESQPSDLTQRVAQVEEWLESARIQKEFDRAGTEMKKLEPLMTTDNYAALLRFFQRRYKAFQREQQGSNKK